MSAVITPPRSRLAQAALVIAIVAAAVTVVSIVVMFVTGQPGLQSTESADLQTAGWVLAAVGAILSIVALVRARSRRALLALIISLPGVVTVNLLELVLFLSQLN